MMKFFLLALVALALATGPARAEQSMPAPAASAPTATTRVFGHYILIQAALAGDSLTGVPEAAAEIARLVRTEAAHPLPAAIADQADKLGQATDLAAARAAFKDLSHALIAIRQGQPALAERYYVVHCPMAFDNTGADWLQATKQVANPYFGASMLRCGRIQK